MCCSLHRIALWLEWGSEAYKQWNELGVECGVLLWGYVHMCVLMHMYVCLHTHVCPAALLNSSKPPGCGVKVCLKPKLRQTATSLLWTFPRETWSFIYNKFQLGRLTREAGRPRSCGWASQKAHAQLAPEGISGMLMVCLSGGLQSPELGLSTVLWPSVEAQEVS